jgi:hypothetical protein
MLAELEVLRGAVEGESVAYIMARCRNLWDTPPGEVWASVQSLTESGQITLCRKIEGGTQRVEPCGLDATSVARDFAVHVAPTPATFQRMRQLERWAGGEAGFSQGA